MQWNAFVRSFYDSLGTPLSKELKNLFIQERWADIVVKRVHPSSYSSPYAYYIDALACSLLRKTRDLDTGIDLKAKAYETFLSGEFACKRTNLRLLPYLNIDHHKADGYDPLINQHIVGVRDIVAETLGRFPGWNALAGRFGPGATFSYPSVRSTLADKMNSAPTCTPSANKLLPLWELTAWGRAVYGAAKWRFPVYVRGNSFATARKDATKDRPIGKEPSILVFYQLAIGKAIRSRARKNAGLDLDNGQAVHVQVARESSITGENATLDLENASGTVCTNFVRLVTPPDWFDAMVCVRSPLTKTSEGWRRLEQFSSMGNGFTFELETVLFYSISEYVRRLFTAGGRTLVYGDDIIVPVSIVKPLRSMLAFFGFKLNDQKSFWEGPFRESCGGDFFSGVAVRPFFLKETPHEPQDFIAAANGVRAAMHEDSHYEKLLLRPWFHLLDQLPTEVRSCRGPKDLGDIVIHDDQVRWTTRWRSSIRRIKVYRPVSRGVWPKNKLGLVPWSVFDNDVVFACALYGAEVGDNARSVSHDSDRPKRIKITGILPRDSISGYKIGWSAFS